MHKIKHIILFKDHLVGNERNLNIEIMRIVCCFLVVGIHTTPILDFFISMDISGFNKALSFIINGVVRTGLPIFFMISGMFILNSKITTIHSFYRKRLISLIIPFIIYSSLHFFSLKIMSGNPADINLVKLYLQGMLSPTEISPHFWFVFSMVGIYIISPVFIIFFRSLSSSGAMAIVAILLSVVIYDVYFKWILPSVEIPRFGIWMTYFLLGGLLSHINNVGLKKSILIFFFGYILTCAAYYAQYYGGIGINISPSDGGINMIIQCIGLFLIFRSLRICWAEKYRKYIMIVSSRAYGIYLSHIFVLTMMPFLYDRGYYSSHIVLFTICATTLVFIMSFILSCVVDMLLTNRLIAVFR